MLLRWRTPLHATRERSGGGQSNLFCSMGSSEHEGWTPATVALSCFLFVAAGVCEVGGGWLVWKALREASNERVRFCRLLCLMTLRRLGWSHAHRDCPRDDRGGGPRAVGQFWWRTASYPAYSRCRTLEGSTPCTGAFSSSCRLSGVRSGQRGKAPDRHQRRNVVLISVPLTS